METTFKIRSVKNGYILQIEENEEIVFSENVKDKLKAFQHFLCEIKDYCGYTGSRYDKRRLHVTIEHGDKYDCFDKDCEICKWGNE